MDWVETLYTFEGRFQITEIVGDFKTQRRRDRKGSPPPPARCPEFFHQP